MVASHSVPGSPTLGTQTQGSSGLSVRFGPLYADTSLPENFTIRADYIPFYLMLYHMSLCYTILYWFMLFSIRDCREAQGIGSLSRPVSGA